MIVMSTMIMMMIGDSTELHLPIEQDNLHHHDHHGDRDNHDNCNNHDDCDDHES